MHEELSDWFLHLVMRFIKMGKILIDRVTVSIVVQRSIESNSIIIDSYSSNRMCENDWQA